ncbi:hypothetical protein Taro_003362 [Colocasia esculenta]|uniref:Protein FAR1-RELATED SEQUENCE n=1 Tax=Colocasia esculenta TaxID=4460 RepID=A0A843TLF7_COLES|nr:hypothetical protein [Colocasia esculenta]
MFEKEFIVTCDKTGVVICGCRCFEFRGCLCRHALVAFQLVGISSIPQRYILKRWTKEMRYRHSLDEYNMDDNNLLDESSCYSYLVHQTVKITEISASSNVAFNVAKEVIPMLLKRMLEVANANIVEQPSEEIRV